MQRIKSHLLLLVSFAFAGLLTASLATGTAQSAVASLVQIVNTAANPVPMQDIDNGARQPVTFATNVVVLANAVNGFVAPAYTVPAGKRLVIEYVSATADVKTAEHVLYISLANGGIVNRAFAPVLDTGPLASNPSLHTVMVGQPVIMYVDPADTVMVGVTTNGGADGVGNMLVQVNGYLVNLP